MVVGPSALCAYNFKGFVEIYKGVDHGKGVVLERGGYKVVPSYEYI